MKYKFIPYIVSPLVFVIILFLAFRFNFLFSYGDEDGLGVRSIAIGFAPAIIIYLELLVLGIPIFWMVNYIYKLNIIGCFISVILTVFLVFIPILLNLPSEGADVIGYFLNLSMYIGVAVGVLLYTVVFYWLKNKLNSV